MLRFIAVLVAMLSIVGCDPISHTEITVRTEAANISLENSDVIRLASKSAALFGLAEMKRSDTRITFTDNGSGQNPAIWLTVNCETNSADIRISEMYIWHPTNKHKRVAQSLIREFDLGGYITHIEYQTPDAPNGFLLFGTVLVLIGLLYWRFMRKQNARVVRETAI